LPGEELIWLEASAIVFDAPESAGLVAEEVPAPGPGEVMVEAVFSQISTGTEMICYRGEADEGTHWAPFMHYPRHNGYCVVGRICAVGDGIAEVAVGDRVCATAVHRSHSNVAIDRLWAPSVPDGISDEAAAWAILAVITQTGVRMAEHMMGDCVVVIGLGPLGQLVVQYLSAMGMREILVIDRVQSRIDAALTHGATAGLCGNVADAKPFVEERTGGDLADVVYDVTGHWAVLPDALPLARDHGTLLMLGDSPFPSKQRLTYDVVSRQVKIVGTRSSWLPPAHARWTPQRQTDLFFEYLQRGAMQVEDIISHVFAPEEAQEAYDLLHRRREETIGVLFDWQGGQ
jgi:2-desacetyl-2-hydroxyethyl bacteriochlorophyllide A dehydrogenase